MYVCVCVCMYACMHRQHAYTALHTICVREHAWNRLPHVSSSYDYYDDRESYRHDDRRDDWLAKQAIIFLCSIKYPWQRHHTNPNHTISPNPIALSKFAQSNTQTRKGERHTHASHAHSFNPILAGKPTAADLTMQCLDMCVLHAILPQRETYPCQRPIRSGLMRIRRIVSVTATKVTIRMMTTPEMNTHNGPQSRVQHTKAVSMVRKPGSQSTPVWDRFTQMGMNLSHNQRHKKQFHASSASHMPHSSASKPSSQVIMYL